MKDKRLVKTFKDHQKKLNISDVNDSYFILEQVKILMVQSYISGRDNHKSEKGLNDMKILFKDFNDRVINNFISNIIINH